MSTCAAPPSTWSSASSKAASKVWKLLRRGLAVGLATVGLWSTATVVALAYNAVLVSETERKLVISTFGVDYGFSLIPPRFPDKAYKHDYQFTIPERWVTATSNVVNALPICLRANLDAHKVTWLNSPTKQEVREYLLQREGGREKYQNITLLTHGSYDGFCVKRAKGARSSACVSVDDLQAWHVPPRSGELIQHNCGGGDRSGPSLEEVLLEDPSSGFKFDRDLLTFGEFLENYYSVWARVFNKQYQDEKSRGSKRRPEPRYSNRRR